MSKCYINVIKYGCQYGIQFSADSELSDFLSGTCVIANPSAIPDFTSFFSFVLFTNTSLFSDNVIASKHLQNVSIKENGEDIQYAEVTSKNFINVCSKITIDGLPLIDYIDYTKLNPKMVIANITNPIDLEDVERYPDTVFSSKWLHYLIKVVGETNLMTLGYEQLLSKYYKVMGFKEVDNGQEAV